MNENVDKPRLEDLLMWLEQAFAAVEAIGDGLSSEAPQASKGLAFIADAGVLRVEQLRAHLNLS